MKKNTNQPQQTRKKNYITIFYVFKLARKSNLEPRNNKKRIKGRSDARSNTQTNHNKQIHTNKQANKHTHQQYREESKMGR